MFTGIVEEVGIVKRAGRDFVEISCQKVLEASKIGDSICVDGVCQTIDEMGDGYFRTRISGTTSSTTTFNKIKSGSLVNLERALTLSSRLGGHIVTGHVEGVAVVKKIEMLSEFYNLYFEIPQALKKYVVSKGSITLNGISLTVAKIDNCNIMTAIIPHTFENTNLKLLQCGDFVNLETDILSKYVENFLSTGNNSVIDENFLRENGF